MKNALIICYSILLITNCLSAQTVPDSFATSLFRRTSGWTAGDVTISIPLPDGRSLWLFGDSYIDNVSVVNGQHRQPCFFQVRSAGMVQDGFNFRTLLDDTKTGVARTLFKKSDNVFSDPVMIPAHGYTRGDTAFVFLGRNWNRNSSYDYLGMYIAKFQLPSLKLLSMTPVPAASVRHIAFGVAVLKNTVGDSLYIYGSNSGWLDFNGYVAKCHINNVLTKWEYFTGHGWSSDTLAIDTLRGSFIGTDHLSNMFSVIKKGSKYYLISQQIGYLTCGAGRKIFAYQSKTPYGPFTNEKLLYTIEDKFNGDYNMTYGALAHPQFSNNCNLLVSYNLNLGTNCAGSCNQTGLSYQNADGYRPKFINIPWSLIDPTACTYDAINTAPASENTNRLKSYPNPSTGFVEVTLETGMIHKAKLFSTSGLVVWSSQKIDKQTFTQDWSTLPKGIYLLHLTTESGDKMQKIILE